MSGGLNKQNYTAQVGGASSNTPVFPSSQIPLDIPVGGIDRQKSCFIGSVTDQDGNIIDFSSPEYDDSNLGYRKFSLDGINEVQNLNMSIEYHGVGYDPRLSVVDSQSDFDSVDYPRNSPILKLDIGTTIWGSSQVTHNITPTSSQVEYLIFQDLYERSSASSPWVLKTTMQILIIFNLSDLESEYRPRELAIPADVAALDSIKINDAIVDIDNSTNSIDIDLVVNILKETNAFDSSLYAEYPTEPSYWGLYANADLSFILDDTLHFSVVDPDLSFLNQFYFNNALLSAYNSFYSTAHATLTDLQQSFGITSVDEYSNITNLHLRNYTDVSATISYYYKRTTHIPGSMAAPYNPDNAPRIITNSYSLKSSANVGFPKITKDILYSGGEFYDCFYLVNHSSEVITDLRLTPSFPKYGGLQSYGTLPPGITLELGFDPAGVGDGVTTGVTQTLPDNTTVPTGVTFSNPAEINSISMGTSKRIGVWFKIVVQPKTLLYSNRFTPQYDNNNVFIDPGMDNHFSFKIDIEKKI